MSTNIRHDAPAIKIKLVACFIYRGLRQHLSGPTQDRLKSGQ